MKYSRHGSFCCILHLMVYCKYTNSTCDWGLQIWYKKCLDALQCLSAELYKNISQTLLMKLCHNFYFLPYFAKMRSKFVLDLIYISFQYYIWNFSAQSWTDFILRINLNFFQYYCLIGSRFLQFLRRKLFLVYYMYNFSPTLI